MDERDAAERALMVRAPASLTASRMPVQELLGQVAVIQEVMQAVMKPDVHYGKIPGTPKPTLYKPGAEVLNLAFRLDAEYESAESWDGDHLTVKSKCTLYHVPSGDRLGSGEGMCSTKESKYAYRKGERKCPKCGASAIIKGQEKFGGGWICWKRKDGCGAQFKDGDKSIEGQATGRIPNPDLADQYNTILKMANKRSLVAATLNVTAASDMFTQDLEDIERHREPEAKPEPPKRKTSRSTPKDEQHPVDPEVLPPDNSPEDKTQGFGADTPDRKLTKEEQKSLWGTAYGKAKEESVKATGDVIMRKVLDSLNVSRTDEMTEALAHEAMIMIKHWKDEE